MRKYDLNIKEKSTVNAATLVIVLIKFFSANKN